MGMSNNDAILMGTNTSYIKDLYAHYVNNPAGLDPSWRALFDEMGDDTVAVLSDLQGASWSRPGGAFVQPDGLFGEDIEPVVETVKSAKSRGYDEKEIRAAVVDSMRMIMMIRAYRVRGHLNASLDPLGMNPGRYHPELDPRTYGFTEEDMEREFFLDNVLGLEKATLRTVLATLRRVYCSTIGLEFMHIMSPDQKSWLQSRMENAQYAPNFNRGDKRNILKSLNKAEGFEHFLSVKYPGTRRFGLDGSEAAMPLMDALVEQSARLGVEEVVVGMAHRGRLNVLANFMGKPYRAIFSEFEGVSAHPDHVQGQGDVKYHLGTSADRDFGGETVHLSLAANPSHLEVVDPVVLGKVRAKQAQKADVDRSRVMGMLLHGDAAFAGQGIVAECFGLSDLRGYRTGGTAHIIVNNQIGFTTNPMDSRSSPYASDIAKYVEAPIFHVNGDHPEAVVHAARLAAEFRSAFQRDVVLDLYCYRRFGHNEGDEPAFTQPQMYRLIGKQDSVLTKYSAAMVAEAVTTETEVETMRQEFHNYLDGEFEAAKTYRPNKADWLEGKWSGLDVANTGARRGETGVPMDILKSVGAKLTHVPDDFNMHRTLKRVMVNKQKMLETGEGFDWATAESLAFGTLLVEGNGVRLSGQDCGRGTFSQRHAVLTDQETEQKYRPLDHVAEDQATFEVYNSLLSEAAVLGFEYGFTLADPESLVIWEAQFGDFANGAQVVIDQFISSGEDKWFRMSGVVMLLPHGYEGQGPEHSSARPERYLQLCGADNMQVANVTTPAQYFHILRRQLRRNFRKPLIIMTPKSLLRHKRCVSKLAEMASDAVFHRVLWDDYATVQDDDVKRVIMCTGKVYYDLIEKREDMGAEDTYILRLEQLYPFPNVALEIELKRFGNATDFVWCQEEPENMGYWFFVRHRIENVLKGMKIKYDELKYAGRKEAASPATGSAKKHKIEQDTLCIEAFNL